MAQSFHFSLRVTRGLGARIKQEIIQAAESSPELRKEIARVFQQVTGRAVCVPCGFNTCALLRCFSVGVHCYGFVPVGSITTPCCSRFNMSLYSAKYIPSVCRLSISTNVLRPVKLPMRSRLFALYGCACLLSL